MSTLFFSLPGWIVRASWQAAILTVVVLVIQWIFQKQLTSRWRHALWILVVARLALPFPPSSPISLYNYARMEKAAPQAAPITVAEPTPQEAIFNDPHGIAVKTDNRPVTAQIIEMRPFAPPAATTPTGLTRSFGLEDAPKLCAMLWVAGMLFFTGRILWENSLFLRRLGAPREPADLQTLALLERCCEQMGVRTKIRLMETNTVKSPALYGLFRKTLLLPTGLTQRLSENELRHIFLHEIAHVKRYDVGELWLVTACKILHWFNPVLWYGFRRMAADRELACDELALCYAGEKESGSYGETILKLLELCTSTAEAPGVMGILEEKAQMRRRISMIANFRRHSRWSALAGVLLLAVGLVTLTDAQTDKTDAKPGLASSAQSTKEIQSLQTTIAAYDQARQNAAAAVFQLGKLYQQMGRSDQAETQFQRILREFPDQPHFAALSQQYVLGLPEAPPTFELSIGDVAYPGGVAIDSAGNIYVSDTHNNRIRKFTDQGVAIAMWGGEGISAGQLRYPQGLAIDSSNNVYVADVDNNRVQKFTSDGTFITQWGELGSGSGKFNRPYNVAVDKDQDVYVVDNENNRVQKFTSDGVYLTEFGTLGTGSGQLQQPQGVAVDANGNVYVGDGGNGRIVKFSAGGGCLAMWMSQGNHDVAVDAQGHVYVVDAGEDCVKMYSESGELRTQWGGKGALPGQFDFAARVAVNPAGTKVLVTDAKNNRVEIFKYSDTATAP